MRSAVLSMLASASLGLALSSNPVIAQPMTAADSEVPTSTSAPQPRRGDAGLRSRGHGAASGDREARRKVMEQLTTPEERSAMREKMQNASPEQRKELANGFRAGMQARAKERGIALPAGDQHRHQHRQHRGNPAAPPA